MHSKLYNNTDFVVLFIFTLDNSIYQSQKSSQIKLYKIVPTPLNSYLSICFFTFFIVSYNSKLIKENVDIIRKLIKNEKILENYQSDLSKIEIPFEDSIVTIYYDGTLSESEIEKLKKDALNLTNSIKRRENLLNNENYVNKAPKEIVENEKKSLEKEKKELEVISLKLK